jgi:protein tyrosine phosphatase
MVWQKDVTCIIMLTKTFDFIKVMCHQYWPNLGSSGELGGIHVRVISEVKLANFYIRRIAVKQEVRGLFQVFQLQFNISDCIFMQYISFL